MRTVASVASVAAIAPAILARPSLAVPAAAAVAKPQKIKPTVLELCAKYHEFHEQGNKYSAESYALYKKLKRARPKPDPRITWKALRQDSCFDILPEKERERWGGWDAIPPFTIQSVIKTREDMRFYRHETRPDGSSLFETLKEPTPLTAAEEATLTDLRERLALAEARLERCHAREAEVSALEERANDMWEKAWDVERHLIRTRSRNIEELNAKLKIFESDPEHHKLIESIARDAMELLTSSSGRPA